MIKINMGVRYPFGACSYYRSMGVFPKLDKVDPSIKVKQINQIDWHFISDADILYLERPQDMDYLTACQIAKDFNVKLWIDYDDNLFDIPQWNPARAIYEKDKTVETIKKCLALADVVTVTTSALQKLYSDFNKNVKIVENAFNDYNYTLAEKPSNNNIINWRGSNTHRGDLVLYSREMSELSIKYAKEWGWSFIGSNLWYVTEYMKACFEVDEMTIPKYWKYIKNVNPSIQISPLVLNDFNTGKSNISWLEGIYAGACHLGPNLTEFRKPGIETYKTPEEFKEKLELLINDRALRKKNFNASLAYIKEHLLLSTINKKRIQIAKELMG